MRPSLFMTAAILLTASQAGANTWNEAQAAAKALKQQAMKTAEVAAGEHASYCRAAGFEYLALCRQTRIVVGDLEALVAAAAMVAFYIDRGEASRILADKALDDYDSDARTVERTLEALRALPLASAEQVKARAAWETVSQELSRITR